MKASQAREKSVLSKYAKSSQINLKVNLKVSKPGCDCFFTLKKFYN